VEVHMHNFLVRIPAVILQNIVIGDSTCERYLFGDRKDISEVVVWDISELFAMVFRNYKGMASGKRTDIEKCKGFLSLQQLQAGYFAPYYLAKEATGD